jgi:Uri superfamily endonuclease
MRRRGAYILVFRLDEDETLEIGRLGRARFERGVYAYVGSAMGGLDARVARHLREAKRTHWHIDYLLARATVTRVLEFETPRRIECELSGQVSELAGSSMPVRGFGSSDCGCWSHLHAPGERGEERLLELAGQSGGAGVDVVTRKGVTETDEVLSSD